MVDRKDGSGWLEGPGAEVRDGYPGERLGMPSSGTGSLGRFGRRLIGVVIDWVASSLIATTIFGAALSGGGAAGFVPLAVFAVENLVLVTTTGTTLGHRIVGLRVVSLSGPVLTPVQVLIRTALLCLFVPAVVWDRDGRGLHDRLAGAAIVRS